MVVSNGIKDTNLKANHNITISYKHFQFVVSNGIKDTNLKANHNRLPLWHGTKTVVSNGIKDTNLKANHNTFRDVASSMRLFPMVSKILI